MSASGLIESKSSMNSVFFSKRHPSQKKHSFLEISQNMEADGCMSVPSKAGYCRTGHQFWTSVTDSDEAYYIVTAAYLKMYQLLR